MAVQGFPVLIVESGGIPVNPVDANYPLMTVAMNGCGLPIIISPLGAPFVVQGYDPGPEPDALAFLATDEDEPLVDDAEDAYIDTYPEA